MYNMKHLWFEKGAYASKKARLYQANEFEPNKVKNIAVIRHAALGDQVITRAFLIEARKFFFQMRKLHFVQFRTTNMLCRQT